MLRFKEKEFAHIVYAIEHFFMRPKEKSYTRYQKEGENFERRVQALYLQ